MNRSFQTILVVLVAVALLTGVHFLVSEAVELSSGHTGYSTIQSDVSNSAATGHFSSSNSRLIPRKNQEETGAGNRSILFETGLFILLGSGLLAVAGWGKRKRFRK